MKLAFHGSCALLAPLVILAGCEPEPARRPSTQATSQAAPTRDPVFADKRHKAEYDRGVAGLRAMDAMRGKLMTDAMANDLEYKCADLREVQTRLAGERDPLVWKLRSTIDKTCRYDVPLACALFELDRMTKKRSSDPGADLKGDCNALKIALGDVGQGYLENPPVVDAGGKYLTYCGGSDTNVKAVRDAF